MNRERVEYAIAETAAKATVGVGRGLAAVSKSKVLNNRFVRSAGDFMLGAAIAAVAVGGSALAADEGGAENVFKEIESNIGKWVQRIAGIVIIFGGVNAGIGIANQDDAGRNRGFMTMAGGAIVFAIVSALGLATSGT